ncbi:MAG: glycosyltransferase family 4 protein, partial [Bacteriovoracaceae bacterium]|nr:glycosyltransferase family 4 protein [Bacteriovoracaceae bacterium]
MKLRILHITSRADVGGGPQHVFDLTSSIKEHDSEIEIFIASPDQLPFAPKYQYAASKWQKIPSQSINLKSLLALRKFYTDNNIDLVHSHGRGAGYFSRFLKLTAGAKVIHTFHGVHSLPGIKEKIKLTIDKFLAPLTDKFISVSDDERSKAITLGVAQENKIEVIYNGVDGEKIRTEFNSATREDSQYFTIGTLARFDYVKGIDILLNFFHRYFKENPNKKVRVLVAGDGPEQEKLEAKKLELGLEEKVIFVGRTDRPIHFLKQLDLYI